MTPTTAAPALVEAHCVSCQKRLLDYVNAIREGHVILRKRCRHCHTMNEIEVKGARAMTAETTDRPDHLILKTGDFLVTTDGKRIKLARPKPAPPPEEPRTIPT